MPDKTPEREKPIPPAGPVARQDNDYDSPWPWMDESVLRALYVEDGKSKDAIARELGCSHDTVARWINRHGLTKTDE